MPKHKNKITDIYLETCPNCLSKDIRIDPIENSLNWSMSQIDITLQQNCESCNTKISEFKEIYLAHNSENFPMEFFVFEYLTAGLNKFPSKTKARKFCLANENYKIVKGFIVQNKNE